MPRVGNRPVWCEARLVCVRAGRRLCRSWLARWTEAGPVIVKVEELFH